MGCGEVVVISAFCWVLGMFTGWAVTRFIFKERTWAAERDKREAESRLACYVAAKWKEVPKA